MQIPTNQTRGVCPKHDNMYEECEDETRCKEGFRSSYGIETGKCIKENRACEVKGWCPTGLGDMPRHEEKPLLEDVYNFTVWLRNFVEFPECGGHKGANLPTKEEDWVDCLKNPRCPYFKIGDMVEKSGMNFTEAARDGSVFRIRIIWDCNFDWGWTVEECLPKYEFHSINYEDRKLHSNTTRPTYFEFKSTQYISDNNRTLSTMRALKFIISVEGKGRQFDFFTFIITVGASTGLFCVAPFACDLILSLYKKYGKSYGLHGKDSSLPVDVTQLSTITLPSTVVQIGREENK